MIDQHDHNNQLPKEIHHVFRELEITKHLRNAGISKGIGFSTNYLFQLVFCLVFQHKSWFTLLQSKKGDQYPGKDTVYRFLNYSKYAWRRFLTYFSAHTIHRMEALETAPSLVPDMIDRALKQVYLLSMC